MKQLISGNWALCEGAVMAGCDAYFGYPITPQNEVTEHMSKRMPEEGRIFLQSESELAAISMVMGGGATGKRVMTSSSSPGISLMQEGISYMCGCEIPAVIANIVRGGPGLGSIGPAQSDYFQAVRGGGHGDYNMCVVAPTSVQETFDFVFLAFDLAFKYRNPVMILTDGMIGQMMEPLEFRRPDYVRVANIPDDIDTWALTGNKDRPARHLKSLYLGDRELEQHNYHLQEKFAQMRREETRFETILTGDAEFLFVAYGICMRVCREAVTRLREKGIKVGLLRPITVWPFPEQWLNENAPQFRNILCVELSCGQMIYDVRLAVEGKCPVSLYGRPGGEFITVDETVEAAEKTFAGEQ